MKINSTKKGKREKIENECSLYVIRSAAEAEAFRLNLFGCCVSKERLCRLLNAVRVMGGELSGDKNLNGDTKKKEDQKELG